MNWQPITRYTCPLCADHESYGPGVGCILCEDRRIRPGADEPIEQIEGAWLRALADAADERLEEVTR